MASDSYAVRAYAPKKPKKKPKRGPKRREKQRTEPLQN